VNKTGTFPPAISRKRKGTGILTEDNSFEAREEEKIDLIMNTTKGRRKIVVRVNFLTGKRKKI